MTDVQAMLQRLAALGVTPSGVADDSRQVRPGDLFLAYPGDLADGRRYIADAIARGAAAVFWEPGGDFAWDASWNVPQLAIYGLRSLAGILADQVLGHPSNRLSLIAVTGTNGKTTVTQFVSEAWPGRCAVIGTLGAGFPGQLADTGFTTPEATVLMRLLAGFVAEGAQACALEASSIGIEEGRMNGARVDVAVFTNFTRDHLDYHGSMEAYATAKEKLFLWPGLRTAIVNVDDDLGRRLLPLAQANKLFGYGIGEAARACGATIVARDLLETPDGQSFTLELPGAAVSVQTALLGRFNVSNLLAVAAVLFDAGMGATEIARRLGALRAPAGRLERRGGQGEPLVVVDYAHTPDALENALLALRPVAGVRGGKLNVVFGCGGDRDKGKRPQMGALAERLADRVLLTSDNPRSENPLAILDDIRAGMARAEIEADRAVAIARAITSAADEDVILLAGKGHEPYQEVAGVRTPFSDLEHAESALAARRSARREVAR